MGFDNPFDIFIVFPYSQGNPTRNASYKNEGRRRSVENGIKKEEKTAISNSTVIVGSISAKEHLIINGRVKGNIEIKGYNLFIGPKGRLEGEVHAQNVRIRGHMRGEIKASGTVEITKEADFSGDIESKGVSVEKGAFFDASVKLGR